MRDALSRKARRTPRRESARAVHLAELRERHRAEVLREVVLPIALLGLHHEARADLRLAWDEAEPCDRQPYNPYHSISEAA